MQTPIKEILTSGSNPYRSVNLHFPGAIGLDEHADDLGVDNDLLPSGLDPDIAWPCEQQPQVSRQQDSENEVDIGVTVWIILVQEDGESIEDDNQQEGTECQEYEVSMPLEVKVCWCKSDTDVE